MFALPIFQNKPFVPMLGLDLSATSAKLVELSMRKEGRLVLERCAVQSLEPAPFENATAESFAQTVQGLRRLIKKCRTSTRNVAMALPSTAVATKIISLPKGKNESAFEVLIEQEAIRLIPYPLDEANLDYHVIGPNLAAPHLLDVHVAVTRREKVQDFSELIKAAGLNLMILDVSSYASRAGMKRLVDNQFGPSSTKLVALVELGVQSTSIRVMQNDVVLYDRDQPFGGAQLTVLISEHYHLSFEEAEAKKRNADLPKDYLALVLTPFVEHLAVEINRALAFFFANTPFRTIDALMLAGGSACLPGLRASVEAVTQYPCFLANPFEGMLMRESVRLACSKLQTPAFLTACGLALRRFSR